ncbi:MAG: hypothetical protein L6244_05880 [Candidatus Methanoperedenaceae archaeon]|nr:hypothetical protein [Candidatus Methanoperedenaceae archaeon]
MNFKGSKTEKNLLAAFTGESQARKRQKNVLRANTPSRIMRYWLRTGRVS